MQRPWGALLGLLWVQICWVRGVRVEQNPSALSPQEGTNPTLRCSFSAPVDEAQWFRQNPGGGLINLFFITSGTKQNGRLSSTMNSKEQYNTLQIRASQLEDSATTSVQRRHSAPRWAAACTQRAAELAPTVSAWQRRHSSIFTALGLLIHFASI
uniref:Immunoglobulin V-set domain-containing protein n=1 Tax=Catagonus wagneri TaxID=51154 RepID=A0A8C3VZN6_9CETA